MEMIYLYIGNIDVYCRRYIDIGVYDISVCIDILIDIVRNIGLLIHISWNETD